MTFAIDDSVNWGNSPFNEGPLDSLMRALLVIPPPVKRHKNTYQSWCVDRLTCNSSPCTLCSGFHSLTDKLNHLSCDLSYSLIHRFTRSHLINYSASLPRAVTYYSSCVPCNRFTKCSCDSPITQNNQPLLRSFFTSLESTFFLSLSPSLSLNCK